MTVTLTRIYRSEVQCRGVLTVDDGGEETFRCKTLELPWKDNTNRISCIPPGPLSQTVVRYGLEHREAYESGSFNYPHFIVRGVDGRTYILIHAGNLYTDILGCILVGTSWVDINEDGHPDVVNSRDTLAELRSVVPDGVNFDVGWEEEIGEIPEIPIAEPETEPEPLALPDLSRLPTEDISP